MNKHLTLIPTSDVQKDLGSFSTDFIPEPAECLFCQSAIDEPVKNVDFRSDEFMLFCSHTCEENWHYLDELLNENTKGF